MKVSPVIWSAVQVFGKQGISFFTFVLLTFYLTPKEFGLIGMAMTWISFMTVFSEIGFGAAIIQSKILQDHHISTVYGVNLVAGVILTALGICISPLAGMFYKSSDVTLVLAILSFGFLINSVSLTHVALAQKEMKFRDLAIRDLVSSIIGSLVGVILAIKGFAVWSLVAQTLATYTVSSFLMLRMSVWNPKLHDFNFSCLKEIWPYSSRIFYFNLFKFFSQNTDKLVIGYFMGPVALGLYTFAYRIILYPVSIVAGAVSNYLFPKFAMHQTDNAFLKTHFELINKVVTILLAPLMLLWLTSSKIILDTFTNGKWSAATTLVQYMAIIAIVQIFYAPVGQLMKAVNKPGLLLKWSVGFNFLTMVCLIFGAKGTIESVGLSLLIAHLVGLLCLLYIVYKLINIDNKSYVDMYQSTVIASIAMLVSLYLINIFECFTTVKLTMVLILPTIIYICACGVLEKKFLLSYFRSCLLPTEGKGDIN